MIGEALRAAFLRGEAVVAAHFAQCLGISRQGVAGSLERLEKRGLIRRHQGRRTGSATPPVIWTCVDTAAMESFVPKRMKRSHMSARQRLAYEAAHLLEAWGIRLADIDLPARRHVMSRTEDDLDGDIEEKVSDMDQIQ